MTTAVIAMLVFVIIIAALTWHAKRNIQEASRRS